MNEEQRAVLAAIGRMEQAGGTLVDEYTVAQATGIVQGELAGPDYAHSRERGQIRRLLEELEAGGMLRLSREGYWRPRTTLAGRRAWQNPGATLLPPGVVATAPPPPGRGATTIPDIFGDDGDEGEDLPPARPDRQPVAGGTGPEEAPAGGWPAWWPTALRLGDPARTPILGAAAAGLLAVLLVVVIAARVAGARGAAATPTVGAVAQTATAFAAQPPPTAPPASSAPPSIVGATGTQGASGRPSAAPTATTPRAPTATAGPASARVRIVNTELQGAWLFATPAGENTRVGIPEGTVVEIVGPDERDTKGRNWKHIRWGEQTYWILEEYTTPAE